MALSTHIIVDYTAHKGVPLFWKYHENRFLSELSPVKVSIITLDNPLELVLDRVVQDGWKKIILLGSNWTLFQGINRLMRLPDSLRQTLELGLWPLTPFEISSSFFHTAPHLTMALRVLKMGQVWPIDLVKVQCGGSQKQVLYFWEECRIINGGENTQLEFKTDQKRYIREFPAQYRFKFYETGLHCILMDPSRLVAEQQIGIIESLNKFA